MGLKDHARQLLVARWERLGKLLRLDAPIALIASEAALIADAGIMLDPKGHVTRTAEHIVSEAKRKIGLCTYAECEDKSAQDDDLCPGHAAAFAEDLVSDQTVS